MLRYAISDRLSFPGDEQQRLASLLHQAHSLAALGIDFFQLREKDLPPSGLLSLARALRTALPHGTPPALLLNAPVSLAVDARADGVHLPGGWVSRDLLQAREDLLGAGLPSPILSVTAHTLPEVAAAAAAGADLILFGPVFEKRVHGALVQPGLSLGALAAAVRIAGSTPVLGLGGVTAQNLPGCLATGAAGVAAIRLFRPPVEPTQPPRS